MPNWCNNYIELSHSNPQMITRAVKAMKRGEFLQEFVPCPKELRDTTAGFSADEEAQAELNKQHEANIKAHGYPTWYEWNIANWGTKWDLGTVDVNEVTEISLTATFDSAWSPPIAAMEQLSDMGFEVILYYYEPGVGFCGKYSSEYGEHTYTIGEDEIPEDIDDMFGVTENQWDEDEE